MAQLAIPIVLIGVAYLVSNDEESNKAKISLLSIRIDIKTIINMYKLFLLFCLTVFSSSQFEVLSISIRKKVIVMIPEKGTTPQLEYEF